MVKVTSLTTLFLFPLFLSNPAFSQQEDFSEGLLDLSLEQLLEVKIDSASAFSESSLRVAASVSVVEPMDWQTLGARNSNEAIQHLPGVSIAPLFGGVQNVKIRGYSILQPRGLSYILDDVPLNSFSFNTSAYHMNNIGLSAIDRFEVIRGPVSVQYGSDAFHGAVAIKSYRSKKEETQLSGRLGSNSYADLGMRHTSFFGDHYLHATLQLTEQGDQGIEYDWQDSGTGETGTGEWGKLQQYGMLTLKLGSKDESQWFYHLGLYLKSESLEDYSGYGALFGNERRDRDSYDNDNDFAMLRAEFGYRIDSEHEYKVRAFHWDSSLEHARWFAYDDRRTWNNSENRSGVMLSAKGKLEFMDSLWSVAGEYDRSYIMQAKNRSQDESGNINSQSKDTYHQFQRDVASITAQATSNLFGDEWFLNYGFRHDADRAGVESNSPRLGLIYQYNESSSLKALYGQGFRASSAGERGGFGTIVKGKRDLNPEIIDSYELVHMMNGEGWSSELVLFKSIWSNFISQVPSSDPDYNVEYGNQGEAESRGAEYYGSATSGAYRLDFGASYVESWDRENDEPYLGFPPRIFQLGLGYTTGASSYLYLAQRLESGAKATLSNNSKTLPDLWQMDLAWMNIEAAGVQWSFNVRNLLDRDNQKLSYVGREDAYPFERRSFSLTARKTL